MDCSVGDGYSIVLIFYYVVVLVDGMVDIYDVGFFY